MIRFLVLVVFLVVPWVASAVPVDWQMGFQEPVTESMERIVSLHSTLMVVLSVVLGLVFLVLFYVCVRFNKASNPVPSKCSHNVMLEVVWTIIPLCIVLTIAVPSVKLLKYQETVPKSELTLKITGYQWYWNYEYPEYEGISFDSNIKYDIHKDEYRLLEVDNRVLLPVNTNIKLLITAADVIHSWAIPQFGIKQDAMPGRLNEAWVNIKKEGVYYGQCSELCGKLHGFMPIVVKAVSREEFDKWINNVKV